MLAATDAGSGGFGDARLGQKIFARTCAACHGMDGRGDGPGAAQLDPRPRDLTTRQYRFRSTATGALPLPSDLERTIREGLPGTSMPGFGELLSSEQLGDLIAFIYSLQPPAARDSPLPEPLSLASVPEPTPERIREGHALYLLSGCWRCHGVDGNGKGPSAKTLVDESERPIRAANLRRDPLERGRSAEDIVRILRTGLNGAPMPSYDEAMLAAREDIVVDPGLEARLSLEAREAIDDFRRASPTREQIDAMSRSDLGSLRDRRLADVAFYVLSLTRRSGAYFWLFVEEPEREARKP